MEVFGQRVDLGSHRLHPATPPELIGRIRSLLGEELQTRTRNGRIRLQDRWVGFPLRFLDMLGNLPLAFTARAAAQSVAAPLRRRNPDTFAEAIDNRLGRAVLDDFYGPYAQKLYGVAASELSAELARRRVSADSAMRIAEKVIRAARGSGARFLYPAGGYGRIAERLAEAAVDAGVEIQTSTPVVGLRRGSVTTAGERCLDTEVILSTMPLTALVRTVRPTAPEPILEAASKLRTRAMVLVYVALDRARYTPFDAHYLPGPDTISTRISEPKNYRDGPDPPDSTVLCFEMPCFTEDSLWSASDADLGAMAAPGPVAVWTPRREPSRSPCAPAEIGLSRLRALHRAPPGRARELGGAAGRNPVVRATGPGCAGQPPPRAVHGRRCRPGLGRRSNRLDAVAGGKDELLRPCRRGLTGPYRRVVKLRSATWNLTRDGWSSRESRTSVTWVVIGRVWAVRRGGESCSAPTHWTGSPTRISTSSSPWASGPSTTFAGRPSATCGPTTCPLCIFH